MADESLLDKVHSLSDLELAVLLCLVSRQHCLISTPRDTIDDLVQELQLVATKTFGLKSAVVINCTPSTTLEDFACALLPPQPNSRSASPLQTRSDSYFPQPNLWTRRASTSASPLLSAPSHIANIVLAKNLDRAPHAVQIQALELLRTHRIFTRSSVHTAPKQFVFVPVLEAESGGEAHVTAHLNDFFAIAHWHDPEDGFVNLEEADGGDDVETASNGSVVKRGTQVAEPLVDALISEAEISLLGKLSQQILVDVDILRYQMNIVAFLRLHRAVAGGISPAATKHLDQLIRCLAPLHSLDFVTPALVAVAVRKVYLHRIRITQPDQERSLYWGSKLEAVEAMLQDFGPEDVIEDTLEMVTAPL
ncbi:hypothetical protein S7711_01412 [Stachybotrys chartarum IBT 7711]|uniref:magnesium chelatase n=1 Tax=Stachybotrys chartarum (strain CBS 109288 / IBT 7711) TaxID=1280523 RepID=A0A084B6W4_STACB|nr:hypothetical protein S7711_01412 [Stachybotrys chartarum IBT 7711]KFA55049.1 hypothetical protein S40293_03566 [Stachybotrys chartarum IBT 40293]KFA77735.1 hypothetical protein S40288_00464 [Stachybotrys chartarum IBT 40288]